MTEPVDTEPMSTEREQELLRGWLDTVHFDEQADWRSVPGDNEED